MHFCEERCSHTRLLQHISATFVYLLLSNRTPGCRIGGSFGFWTGVRGASRCVILGCIWDKTRVCSYHVWVCVAVLSDRDEPISPVEVTADTSMEVCLDTHKLL
jgi:hypothetical protein